MDENYKSYIISLGEVIREYAEDAKKLKDSSIGKPDEQFTTGYLCGFYRIVTLMQQQAEAYEIPLETINLDLNESDLI